MSHSGGAAPVEVGHGRWRVLVDALSMGIYKHSLGNFFKFRHSRESGIPVSLNCSLRGCRRFRLSARYFLCSCKESTQRKHAPTVPVAARLPCDARSLRRLRNSHPQSRDRGCSGSARRLPLRALCFSAGPTGAPKRSWAHTLGDRSTRRKTKHPCCFCWVPVGPAEKRRRDGSRPSRMFERTQPELRDRVPRRPVPASIAG